MLRYYLALLVLMRLERTVVRREIRGFITDLNSSKSLKSEISLSFVEGVFKLADWWPSVIFAYVRNLGEFSVAGWWYWSLGWRRSWMAQNVEFSCLRYYYVSWRFSDILCILCSWLAELLYKGHIFLVDPVILCKRKRGEFLHIWYIWVDMRSMSVCDHSFGSFDIGV